MRLNYLLFLFIILSCKNEIIVNQELKPWHSVGNKKIVKNLLTDHLNYQSPRKMIKLNEDWTFNYFPSEIETNKYAQNQFDDSKWSVISIPHSYQNYETTKQEHPFILNASEEKKSYFKGSIGGIGNRSYWYYGWGYYRKKFNLIKKKEDERYFIEFEGVMKYCKVYFNGKYLGDHKGGFNAFYYDITNLIKEGEENIIAVSVNNRLNDKHRIPPMQSGNQTHSGGIYRDVKFVVKKDIYIPFQGSHKHEGGHFIKPKLPNKGKPNVSFCTWIKNSSNSNVEVLLKNKIIDMYNHIVAENQINKNIKANTIGNVNSSFNELNNIKIWNLESPYLYVLKTEVWHNNKLKDSYSSSFGFRNFRWDYKDNWGVLNGKKIHIHGTNRTQCFPWVNNAIPDWIDIMDIKDIIFGQNHNFIRPNIHANKTLIHDLFDQWGILVNLSSPMIKDIDFDEDVQKQMVTEAIRRHRNRPSIVMYSTGNETNDGADSKWIYEEDSSRIITARHVHKGQGKYVTHTDENMDMENLLRCTVRGWTNSDIFSLNPEHNQHTGNEEFQHKQARIMGGSQRGRIDMHNGNMWMYCDDGAIRVYKHCPLKWVNPKGWVDVYRVPKYLYFLWQAHYHDKPMAFIHPHYWQEKYIGQKKDIIVDSNCEMVELFVNGKSYGKKRLSKQNFHSTTFKNVKVERGTINVMGENDTIKINNSLKMATAPTKLRIKASHSTIEAKRSSIVMLTVDAVDNNGTQVQEFTKELNWEIEGKGKFIAPKKWKTDINKRSENSGVWYITTPISNFVRSTGEEGEIKIKVSAQGLKSAEISILSKKYNNKNNVITEPTYSNKNREEVKWKEALIEKEDFVNYTKLNHWYNDIKVDVNKSTQNLKEYFMNFLKEKNPSFKDKKIIKKISVAFTKHVKKKNGLLVNDDYNFIIDKTNLYLKSIKQGKKTKLKL
jgi:hypothetical protein